jgi:hypothetical protein
LPVALKKRITSGSSRNVICCLVSGMSTWALSQKPGGIAPASGSHAARRSASASLISINGRFNRFGGGLTNWR